MSIRSASAIGGSDGTTIGSGASDARAGCLCRSQAPPPARPARARNGSIGNPGINASTTAAPDAIASGFGLPPNCRIIATSADPSVPPLVTTMPAAVDTSNDGICDTNPSPAVRVVKVAAASANGIPWRITPMASPPRILITVINKAAMASPRTNFAAPSMAP